MEAISPKEKDTAALGSILDECISWVNDSIICRKWHDNFADPEELRNNYYAIIVSPFGRFNGKVLDETEAEFKRKGWDVRHGGCYDARGPHHCFYVAKKHFNSP